MKYRSTLGSNCLLYTSLQVHDELIVDCAPQDAEKVQQLMHACMEHVVELSVPLEVEVSQGETWLEAK